MTETQLINLLHSMSSEEKVCQLSLLPPTFYDQGQQIPVRGRIRQPGRDSTFCRTPSSFTGSMHIPYPRKKRHRSSTNGWVIPPHIVDFKTVESTSAPFPF